MKSLYRIPYIFIAFLFLLASCDKKEEFNMSEAGKYAEKYGRLPAQESRRVVLLYSAGFNNLNKYLEEDIEDYCSGYLPEESRSSNVALALSHQTKDIGDYSTPVPPYLIRYYKNINGETVRDTLITYPESSNSASPEFLANVLSDVKELFPAKSYGMILSSHATGWLPVGYYSKNEATTFSAAPHFPAYNPDAAFYHDRSDIQEGPEAVKSLIQKWEGSTTYEMDLKNFASCLPYHLEYILFDACLMGGIEVAYELKDKCDFVAFSQTEILAQGFIYEKILERLIGGSESDIMSVCSDYFKFYDETYSTRAATISMADCSKLQRLAQVCCGIFREHESELPLVQGSEVQGFFRYDKHYYYDLRDIICHLDVSEKEMTELDNALSDCLPYRKATPQFLGIAIENYCGLSSYLPSMGNSYLDDYYRDFKWNQETGMVK